MLAHELRNPLGAISTCRPGARAGGGRTGTPASRAREVIARQVGHDHASDRRSARRRARRLRKDPTGSTAARPGRGGTPGRRHVHGRRTAGSATSTSAPSPCGSTGTPSRLEQVLTNLVTNAVKYTPPGGQIRVTLRADGGDAVLSVEDTGFGISPRLLPFIFDLYVQADRTLDRARGGLGIGLTLVRRLVELHGGTMVASSEGEGRGSRFTVRLRQIPGGTRAGGPPLAAGTSCDAQTRAADRGQRGRTARCCG